MTFEYAAGLCERLGGSLALPAACSVLGVLLVVNTASGQPRPPSLEAAWSAKIDGGIEWCEPAGRPRPTVLIVCDRAGRLHVFDLAHGKSLLDEPVAAKTGVRFAGDSAGICYAFDRYSVYAIAIANELAATPGAAQVAWRAGVSDDPPAERDDPEFIVRLLDAAPTPRGVLVVRSDGRVAELSRESGGPLWTTSLPQTRDARAGAFEQSASILFRTREGVAAAFFDLTQPSPAPRVRECGQAWPMWSAPGRTGLVAAWPGRAALIFPEDEKPRFLLQHVGGLRASAIDLYATKPKSDDDASAVAVARPLLVVAEIGGKVSAHDPLSGKPAWTSEGSGDDPHWSRVRVQDELVLTGDGRGAAGAFEASSGRKVAQTIGVTSPRPLGFGATRQRVFAANVASGGGAFVELAASPMLAAGRWSAKDAQEQQARYDLGPAEPAPTAFWPPGRVVLIEPSAVRVYVLP